MQIHIPGRIDAVVVRCHRHISSADGQFLLALDTLAAVPLRCHRHLAARYQEVALRFQPLHRSRRRDHVQRAAQNGQFPRVLRFAVRFVFERHLHPVVAHRLDVQRAAFHGEILVTVHPVRYSPQHVQRTVLQRQVLLGKNRVVRASRYVQRPFPLQFQVPLARDAALPVTTRAICQRVYRFARHAQFNAFPVLYVQCRPFRVRQRQSRQFYSRLVAPFEGQFAVVRLSRKVVGNLAAGRVARLLALHQEDVRPVHRGLHKVRQPSRDDHLRRFAVEVHRHRALRHRCAVEEQFCHLRQLKGVPHDVQPFAVGVRHFAHLVSSVGIRRVVGLHIQRLG